MPPKRKAKEVVIPESGSGSESDTVSLHQSTTTAVLPTVMQNIETLKKKRDKGRKDIAKAFDSYISDMKKNINDQYTVEAEKSSNEAKTLLTRYAEALERRACIEKSIAEIVLRTSEDLNGLNIILEAAYSGRQQQASAAATSLASIVPIPALANDNDKMDTTVLGARNPAQAGTNIDGEGERANHGEITQVKEAEYRNERRGDVVPFDTVTW